MPVVIFYLNLGFNMKYFECHPYLIYISFLKYSVSFRTSSIYLFCVYFLNTLIFTPFSILPLLLKLNYLNFHSAALISVNPSQLPIHWVSFNLACSTILIISSVWQSSACLYSSSHSEFQFSSLICLCYEHCSDTCIKLANLMAVKWIFC
jgi:hypothetical protein